jgi:predicted nucleotidyltransferase
MTTDISEEKLDAYRRSARLRTAEGARRCRELRKRAFAVAVRASDLLKKEYSVESVYLFGSLAEETAVFDERSDVDLAVRGLDGNAYYRVLSRLLDIDHAFDVDLIELETAPESLLVKIEKEGIRL